jgi:hypothetical protein
MITPAEQMVVDTSGMYEPSCAIQREPISTACPIHSPSPSTNRFSHRLLFLNIWSVSRKKMGAVTISGTLDVECKTAHIASLIVTLA